MESCSQGSFTTCLKWAAFLISPQTDRFPFIFPVIWRRIADFYTVSTWCGVVIMQAGTRERLLGCLESGQTSRRRAGLNNFLPSADWTCFQSRKKAEKKESASLLRPRFFTSGSNCNSRVELKAVSCISLGVVSFAICSVFGGRKWS